MFFDWVTAWRSGAPDGAGDNVAPSLAVAFGARVERQTRGAFLIQDRAPSAGFGSVGPGPDAEALIGGENEARERRSRTLYGYCSISQVTSSPVTRPPE